MELLENCTVVIRSVGERTTDLCRYIIEQQVNSDNIFVIYEIPFSKAVHKTFALGLEKKLPWTIAIDADVLVSRRAIRTLIDRAEGCRVPFFKGNARSFDKFYGFVRTICPHIYRTSYLEYALSAFQPEEYLRPETHLVELVNAHFKLLSAQFNDILALHDFEQYYTDIFRKTFVYAKKHPEKISYFINYWGHFIASDDDYLVALSGLYKGLFYEELVAIDASATASEISGVPILSDLSQKPVIPTTKYPKLIRNISGIVSFLNLMDTMPRRFQRLVASRIHL